MRRAARYRVSIFLGFKRADRSRCFHAPRLEALLEPPVMRCLHQKVIAFGAARGGTRGSWVRSQRLGFGATRAAGLPGLSQRHNGLSPTMVAALISAGAIGGGLAGRIQARGRSQFETAMKATRRRSLWTITGLFHNLLLTIENGPAATKAPQERQELRNGTMPSRPPETPLDGLVAQAAMSGGFDMEPASAAKFGGLTACQRAVGVGGACCWAVERLESPPIAMFASTPACGLTDRPNA